VHFLAIHLWPVGSTHGVSMRVFRGDRIGPGDYVRRVEEETQCRAPLFSSALR
jgi:hypothetical protein